MDLLRESALFLTIREAGSLRRAAAELSLSTAAVSRRLSALERELGAVLFLRTTRELKITDAGQRFHQQAQQLLATAQATRECVHPSQGLRGILVVSASVTYGLLWLNPAIQHVLAQHPGMDIELRLYDGLSDLVDEGVDLAIRGGVAPVDSASLIARHIQTLERHLVAAPAYFRRTGRPLPRRPQDLAQHPLLGGVGLARHATLELTYKGDRYTVTPPRRFHTRTLLAIRDAAIEGRGIAVLPHSITEPAMAARSLRRILPAATLSSVDVVALYRIERRGDPAIQAVLDALMARLGADASHETKTR